MFSLGTPVFLPHPKNMQSGGRLIGHSKIFLRCECECGWLFVSVCQPCDELATCPGCTPSPYEGKIG